jgi:cysteinyl-tRNA synthetase
MAAVFDAVRAANRALDAGDVEAAAATASAVRDVTGAVGLDLAGAVEVPPQISELASRREAARAARDFAAADAIRDELAALGWAVEDTPAGPRLHRRA